MKQDRNIGRMLRMTLNAMLGVLGHEFEKAEIPITVEQFIVLKLTASKDDMIQQELADILQKDKSAMLRQLNAMQEQKLLARIADASDKRRNNIVVTKQGMELLARASKVHKKAFAILMKGVSEEQLDAFSSVMETVQLNSKKHIG